MSTVPPTRGYVAQIVLWVGFFLALPLWRELHESGHPIWNVFLVIVLLSLVSAAYFGVRYLQKNNIQVGEARFIRSDTDRR